MRHTLIVGTAPGSQYESASVGGSGLFTSSVSPIAGIDPVTGTYMHDMPEIGEQIAEAMDDMGRDGVITVEKSKTFGMELEFVEEMRFDKGYISRYFVTDPERMEVVYDDPYVLLVEGKVSRVEDILPLGERVLSAPRSLVIIADDVEGQALATLVVNKIRGMFRSVAIQAPPTKGGMMSIILQDPAHLEIPCDPRFARWRRSIPDRPR